jgi:hypothetical protein
MRWALALALAAPWPGPCPATCPLPARCLQLTDALEGRSVAWPEGGALVSSWLEAVAAAGARCGAEEEDRGGEPLLPRLTYEALEELGLSWSGAGGAAGGLLEGRGAVTTLGSSAWERGAELDRLPGLAGAAGLWRAGRLEGKASLLQTDGSAETVAVAGGVPRGLATGTSVRRYRGGVAVGPRWRLLGAGRAMVQWPGRYLLLQGGPRPGAWQVEDGEARRVATAAWSCREGGLLEPAWSPASLGPPVPLLPRLLPHIPRFALLHYQLLKLANLAEQEDREARWVHSQGRHGLLNRGLLRQNGEWKIVDESSSYVEKFNKSINEIN